MMYVSKRSRFSASHRLHNPRLSAEENRLVFGACNHVNGHGHDYELEVVVRGTPDPLTGMFINLTRLKQIVDEHIVQPAAYKCLDSDVPFMRGRISTTENLALAIWEVLAPLLPVGSLHLIRIRESENNVIEYTGPE